MPSSFSFHSKEKRLEKKHVPHVIQKRVIQKYTFRGNGISVFSKSVETKIEINSSLFHHRKVPKAVISKKWSERLISFSKAEKSDSKSLPAFIESVQAQTEISEPVQTVNQPIDLNSAVQDIDIFSAISEVQKEVLIEQGMEPLESIKASKKKEKRKYVSLSHISNVLSSLKPSFKIIKKSKKTKKIKTEGNSSQNGNFLFRILQFFGIGSWKEFFKFATVSLSTFLIVLTVMNFSAYYQIASYWITEWKGEKNTNAVHLENFLASGEMLHTDGTILSAPFLPKAGGEVKPSTLMPVSPPDNRIILPKIGKNVPIVEIPDKNLIEQNWELLEKDIQQGLKAGVVHYPGTATPGQKGNFFVTGHSSYYFWEKSAYKDVFALLPQLEKGDQIVIFYNQKKYTYEITDKQIVAPTNVDVLKQTDDKRITLMTCWPIGTDRQRMILVGKQI